ncbi:phosphonate ABC transporter, permease protein PhnE [Halovivax sp.]|uniref:phosphonate ABC transporter, permease protein PhnE n=1 Tax=Halovivax sp. TaxID=1935978 RepID=UPI0025C15D74|nr:phosphonate ABC transporter, permease protein PhnE [Halovivax sp.]
MSGVSAVERRLEEIRLTRRVRWVLYGLLGVTFAGTFYGSLLLLDFSLVDLWEDTPRFLGTLSSYAPNWEVILERNLPREAVVTLAIGFAGTVIGFPLALLLGVLGSGRVTPFPFNFIFRSIMGTSRAIPALLWFLIFIPLAGLSPVTGTIAIAVSTIGNLGRLFTDELEEIKDGPIEAMQTTGAGKAQVVVFGMLSQVRTSFIAWTLYIFEINVRVAVTLGLLNAGGIGEFILVQQSLRNFGDMMAGIVVVLILIIGVEMISQRLRTYLRAEDDADGLLQLLVGFPRRMAESALK